MGNIQGGQPFNCDTVGAAYQKALITPDFDPVQLKQMADFLKNNNCSGPQASSEVTPQTNQTLMPVSVSLPVSTIPLDNTPPPVTPPPVPDQSSAPSPFNVNSYATCDDLKTAIMRFNAPGPGFDPGKSEQLQDEYGRRKCAAPAPVVQPPPQLDPPPPKINEHGTAGVYVPNTGIPAAGADPNYKPPPTIFPGPSRPPVRARPPQPYNSPDLILYGSIAAGGVLLVLGLYQSMRI